MREEQRYQDAEDWGVPTTPDPNTPAKVSRHKWEACRDTIGGVYTTFCQEEGILLQKSCDRNGRCISILFKSIRVRGRFDSPDRVKIDSLCTLQSDIIAKLIPKYSFM